MTDNNSLKEIARYISGQDVLPGNEMGPVDLARGLISVVGNAYQGGLVGVKIDGSETTVTADCLSSYSPTVGDIVEFLKIGDRNLVIGAIGMGSGVLGYTYAISGLIFPWSSGPVNYIPRFYVPVTSNCTLKGIWGALRNGSCTIEIYQGGSLLSAQGLGALNVTTTDTFFTPSGKVSVANGQSFRPQVTAATGSPDGLTLTFVFDTAI